MKRTIQQMVRDALEDSLTDSMIESAVAQAIQGIDLESMIAEKLEYSLQDIVDEELAEIIENL